ncbi:MAG: 16S rRNA (guanine(966)-N(2))-methyltransferase RsmD [Chlamydiia bacterium]
MHILAGEKKGTPLDVPKEGTRPTTNKIKKSLFDTIQHYVVDAKVLDLFAGSGSLGLEALSRGAAFATFIEKGVHASNCLKKNIDKLGYEERSTLIQSSVEHALKKLESYDLIFMDPPYEMDVEAITTQLLSHLCPGGLLIVEQSKRAKFLTELPYTKKKEYGDTILYFFTHKLDY